MLAWLAALLAARWLIPTEGAVEGLTLWLVQVVLVTAVARMVWAWRFEERSILFDAVDGAIALVIVAQVVSALTVVWGVGHSRAAINLAWEWVGSGVLIWLLRQELRATRAMRPLCLGLSLAAAVLAGYGLWQHYVWYDDMSREYERLTTEHDRLSQSPTDGRRLQALRAEMSRQGIPFEPADRKSLEQRLKSSREPFGLFALANTFAGLLAVMLLVAVGTIPVGAKPWDWIATALLALVIGYCLVLTKSRTAWVGLLAGIGWWMFRAVAARWRRGDASASQRSAFVGWIAGGVVVLGVAVTAAVVSGGLDKAVWSEAPKSVRYRLEYWQGTWATIREHFWLGTGPGNFRDHYLAHKLPESSEEIADPHNFILDVWANAGIFGLIGLLACVGLMARGSHVHRSHARQCVRQVSDQPTLWRAWRLQVESLLSPAVWGVGLAFPLAAIGMELAGQGLDERLWWLGGIWWGLWLIGVFVAQRVSGNQEPRPSESGTFNRNANGVRAWWSRLLSHIGAHAVGVAVKHLMPRKRNNSEPRPSGSGLVTEPQSLPDGRGSEHFNAIAMYWSLEAANVMLLVHLLGAGGIAMPTITQLLWLVWSLRVACSESAATAHDESKLPSKLASRGVQPGHLAARVTALAAGGLCVLCWWTGTMPEFLCRTSLQRGDAEWGRGQSTAAGQRYLEAHRADPWAIEPLERLADIAFQRWRVTQADTDFEESVKQLQVITTQLPFASRPWRRLGQVSQARFEQTRDTSDATRAAEAFAMAVERYPHHAGLLAESATASESAGLIESAREVARRAIRQDDLNRHLGHSDKYLDDPTRRRMERLGGTQSEAN
ncbi:MAG: O-antigen ligase family protein [Planctomycetaceae bacterium]